MKRLAVGFTVGIVVGERPMRVVCLKLLATDSLRPNKLRKVVFTYERATLGNVWT